jgi:putative flippase GtrA
VLQFVKFAIVGLANTLITFLAYTILVYLQVDYRIANVIGYVLGVINSYRLNKSWVFKVEGSYNQLLKFIMVNLITLGINTILLYMLVDKYFIDKIFAQIIVIPVTMMVNFVLNKLWTFERG